MRVWGMAAGVAAGLIWATGAAAQAPAACGAVEPLSKVAAQQAAKSSAPERGFRATNFTLPAAGGTVGCAKSLSLPPTEAIDILPVERFSLNGTPMIALYEGPIAYVGPAAAGLPVRRDPGVKGVYACRFVELGGQAFTLCATTVDKDGWFEVRGAARESNFLGLLSVDIEGVGKWTEFDTTRPPELSADRSGGRMTGTWSQKMLVAIPYGYKAVFEGGGFAQLANGLQAGEVLRMKAWRKDGTVVEQTLPAGDVAGPLRAALAVALAIKPPR